MSYSPWCHKQSDTTERLTLLLSTWPKVWLNNWLTKCVREGRGGGKRGRETEKVSLQSDFPFFNFLGIML